MLRLRVGANISLDISVQFKCKNRSISILVNSIATNFGSKFSTNTFHGVNTGVKREKEEENLVIIEVYKEFENEKECEKVKKN